MVRIMAIIGTRPEIIKMEPVIRALLKFSEIELTLVHSGQHYDLEMSRVFIDELGLPKPDVNLEVGSGTHAQQTARMLLGYEKVVDDYKPHLVLAEGDTNTVVAAGLVAVKRHVLFGHIEAGLRCYDQTMPEEINRVLADDCAQLCFAPTERATLNLLYEGIPPHRIYVTGNTIVDACSWYVKIAEKKSTILKSLRVSRARPLVTVTIHRAENVDVKNHLKNIVTALVEMDDATVIYPVHPRSEKRLKEFGLWRLLREAEHVLLTKPLGYFDFLKLLTCSSFIMTDSGGIQEEAVSLKKPCLTLRKSTERPETVDVGANIVVGTDRKRILYYARKIMHNPEFAKRMAVDTNPLGDGHAGERIAKISIDVCEKGEKLESPSFLKTGSASFKIAQVGRKLAGKSIQELKKVFPHVLVTLVFDERGEPLPPYPELKIKEGWTIRVFGPKNLIERLSNACG